MNILEVSIGDMALLFGKPVLVEKINYDDEIVAVIDEIGREFLIGVEELRKIEGVKNEG